MIAILDYGLGNLRAFANMFRHLNMPCAVASTPAAIAEADKVILPGVGSFDHAMQRLRASGLIEPLQEAVLAKGKPVLGVCVGMQMLARSSEEGQEPGLGWIEGDVRRITFPDTEARGLLPHMGWSTISPRAGEPLFEDMDEALGYYFLHSYRFVADHDADVAALADYAAPFHCAVRRDHIIGVQFHPEKSHHNGLRFLKAFGEL